MGTESLVNIGNTLLDPAKITAIWHEGDVVKVLFDNGQSMTFDGEEARAVWKLFDKSDWRE